MDWPFKLLFGVVITLFVVMLAGNIWFYATHTCVREHQELVPLSCTTDYDTGLTDCTPAHYETVCDEWVKDR